MQVNLERAGYEVVTAFDGKEAVGKVKEVNPELIVCDVMMLYMDGFEVLRTVRADPETRDIPFIMLTAKAQDADIFRGRLRVHAYLTKPFNPMELLAFVKRIFQALNEPGRSATTSATAQR